MADEPDAPRLAPFPDELLVPAAKYRAIAFLNTLQLPPWIATKHLKRWASYTDVQLEARDYRAVEVFTKG